MKKLLFIALTALLLGAAYSCNDDDDKDTWEKYKDWREQNDAWLKEQMQRVNADGTPYYTQIIPSWNPGTYVLIHYFNDRSETAGNLSPLYNSTVDVRYVGRDCEGAGFDSSTLVNSYGRLGVQRFKCNQLIQGWSIALQDMRVGDTCEIVVPYGAGYGSSTSGTIKPYSALRFNMRLEDIYHYEAQ